MTTNTLRLLLENFLFVLLFACILPVVLTQCNCPIQANGQTYDCCTVSSLDVSPFGCTCNGSPCTLCGTSSPAATTAAPPTPPSTTTCSYSNDQQTVAASSHYYYICSVSVLTTVYINSIVQSGSFSGYVLNAQQSASYTGGIPNSYTVQLPAITSSSSANVAVTLSPGSIVKSNTYTYTQLIKAHTLIVFYIFLSCCWWFFLLVVSQQFICTSLDVYRIVWVNQDSVSTATTTTSISTASLSTLVQSACSGSSSAGPIHLDQYQMLAYACVSTSTVNVIIQAAQTSGMDYVAVLLFNSAQWSSLLTTGAASKVGSYFLTYSGSTVSFSDQSPDSYYIVVWNLNLISGGSFNMSYQFNAVVATSSAPTTAPSSTTTSPNPPPPPPNPNPNPPPPNPPPPFTPPPPSGSANVILSSVIPLIMTAFVLQVF